METGRRRRWSARSRTTASAVVALSVAAAPAAAATVRGRLAAHPGASPFAACTVELTVAPYLSGGPGRGAGSESERPRPVVQAPVAGDGSFLLSPVPRGVHTLRALCPTARAAGFLTVGDEPDTAMPAPIVLGETVLRVTLQPRLDPSRRPWKVTLSTTGPAPVVMAAADARTSGEWSLDGLPVGPYTIDVADQRGTTWLSQPVDLTRAARPLSLAIPHTRVAGRVSFGRQPIAAALVFSDPAGARRVAMESGADGSFVGRLPVLSAGDWSLVLTSRRPPLERRLEDVLAQGRPEGRRTWLDLEVESRGATGCVNKEDGAPAPGALVTAEEKAGARVQALANGEGCFDLGAPAAGTYRVWAESPHGTAEPQSVEIADGWPQALRFVLKGSRRVAGRVVADGQPVASASVQAWLSPGVPRSAVEADVDGRFEQAVPSEGAELGVTVIAPGYALKMTRVFLDEGEVEIPLTTSGGELTVEIHGERARDPSVLLTRDGGVEWLDYLLQWGSVHAHAGGWRGVLPRVEAGPYRACLVERSELPALWAGDATAGRCTSGTLADGGRLVLTLDTTRRRP